MKGVKTMKKMFIFIVSMFMFTIMVKGQNPVVDNQLISKQTGINEIITSLKSFNDINLVDIVNTLEKLSNELSDNYEFSNSKDETLGRTDVQNLSSQDIVSVLDNAIFSLDKLNGTCSFDSVISNLKEVSKQYENTSYENLRENVK